MPLPALKMWNICLVLITFVIPSILAGDDKAITTFHYYHKDNPTQPLTLEEISQLGDKPKNALLYSHGYNTESLEGADAIAIKNAVLQNRKDIDIVILADWCEASNKNIAVYPWIASKTVPKVARDISQEIQTLKSTLNMGPENVEMVGHSLGAHVVGQAGRNILAQGTGKIKHITGLDPAGPWFGDEPGPKYIGLRQSDAEWVRVIHTDDSLGLFRDIGDEDIYPYTQPEFRECEGRIGVRVSKCLHSLAKQLFIKELQGARLVDPGDPKRGGERPVKRLFTKYPTSAIILVLDVSPSMKVHSRMEIMIAASTQLINQLEINSTLAIIIFGGSAKVTLPPTQIIDEVVRAKALSALPTTSTHIDFATSIGAGLQAAINLGFDVQQSCPNIHLITDGVETAPPYRRDVEIPPCTRVYPIALGDLVDQGLEKLSQDTGGRMASVSDVTSLNRLGQELEDATYFERDPVSRPLRVFVKEIPITENGVTNFHIDQGVGKDLRVVVINPEFKELQPILTSPSGRIYEGSRGDFNKDGTLPSISTFKQEDAISGDWKLGFIKKYNTARVRRSSTANLTLGSITVTAVQREGHSAVVLDGFLSRNLINYGNSTDRENSIEVYGRIKKGPDFVLGASIIATIVDPDGQILTTLSLKDDGVGPDEEKNDGIYSRYVNLPLQPGQRNEVSLEAKCGGHDVCRLRPKKSFSFDPISSKEVRQFPLLYKFQRQINPGSIKSVGVYRPPLPSRIQDLQVISVDPSQQTVQLRWTAGGGLADSGRASSLELIANWNFTGIVDGNKSRLVRFLQTSRGIMEGSLIPVEVGLTQRVSIKIPTMLWKLSDQGKHLYFRIHAANNASEWGKYSNIAFSSRGIFKEETDFVGSIPLGLGMLVGIFFWLCCLALFLLEEETK